MTHHRYYGLVRPPFAGRIDHRFFFMSETHGDTLAEIAQGLKNAAAFIVCTGASGVGKTALLSVFLERAPLDDVTALSLSGAGLMPGELTARLCGKLGMNADGDVFIVVKRMRERLLELHKRGRTAAVIVDDAQALPADTLEYLQVLGDFAAGSDRLLRVILMGAPELDGVVEDEPELAQCVTLRRKLEPLSKEQSAAYIQHRLAQAGAAEVSQAFSPWAVRAIVGAAGGAPRWINILADHVLIAGYGAQQRPVGGRLAREIIDECLKQPEMDEAPRRGVLERLGL